MTARIWLILALMASLVILPACESETDPVEPTETKPVAATELAATSLSGTEVGLKWNIAADTARKSYVITVVNMDDNSSGDVTIADPNATNVSISGLTAGTVYSFTVYAMNETVKSDASPTIMWSPATRHSTQLRLYETSSEQGSGIELPENAGLTIAAGRLWDICLDTRNESFDIGSPTASSYTTAEAQPKFPNGDVARVTLVGKVWPNVSSLDDVYESADLTSGSLDEALYNFNAQDAAGAPFAFVVKTENGNFAKVRVVATGGKLLQGTAPDRYVDLEISYQSGVDVPYAVKVKHDGPVWKKIDESVIGEHKQQ